MKRIITLIFFLFICLKSIAFDFSEISPTGQILYYNINDDKATVSVTAPMNNTVGASYVGYEKPVGELIIPNIVTHNGIHYIVTAIADNAFTNCMDLKSVIVSDSILFIGDESFKGCSNLRTITISSNLKKIGASAFLSCRKLQSINLPNAITEISRHAFSNCVSLEQIQLPEKLQKIEPYTFYSCEKLRNIEIPNNVESIGESAFAFCRSLYEVVIPNNLKTIEDKAFFSCTKLEGITLPTSLEFLGASSFSSCIALKTIEIPNSVKEINNSLFKYCYNLETVHLPNTIELIENNAFEYCKNLKNINIPSSVTTIGNAVFSNCVSLEYINISPSVESIGSCTFQYCSSLKSINMPSVKNIGKNAFERCRSLIEIDLSKVNEIGEFAFTECSSLKNINLANLDTVRDYVFYTCPKLERVYFGNNIRSIGNYSFYRCYSLDSIEFPTALYTIGVGAFEQCTNLKTIYFNQNIETINEYAFNDCRKLKNLTFKKIKPLKIFSNTWKNLPKDVVITMPMVQDSFLLSLNLGKRVSEVIIDTELIDTTKTTEQILLPIAVNTTENLTLPEIAITNPIYKEEKPKRIEIPQRINVDTLPQNEVALNQTTLPKKETVETKEEKKVSIKVLSESTKMGSVVGTGIYKELSEVRISAKANNGYRFVSWNDGKKENPRIVKTKEDVVYYAIFEEEKYNIEVKAEDKMMGSVYGNGAYELNTVITIKAEPSNGYQFVEWNDGEKENPRKVTVKGNGQSYVAKFSPIEVADSKEKLTCYPNPTRGLVYLSKKANTIEVLNAQGQLMISFKNQSVIDISELPSGTYSLKLTVDEDIQTLKVVLKK